jgi:uncharacterized membrane-anchored protein YitT (DUF2179 family)
MEQLVIEKVRNFIFRYLLIIVGVFIGSLSVIVFLEPLNISSTGVTGIAMILQEVLGTPIGLMVFVLNIPIQVMGYYMLPNGARVIMRSLLVIVLYSIMLDMLAPYVPVGGVSDDRMLNALFGGIIGGISGGMVFRAGASFGGTSTLALILQRRMGTSMSTTFLYTDTLVIILAGFVYGWEGALYATVTLFVGGVATDYVLEGPSVIRTVVIITQNPDPIVNTIFNELQRGATGWKITGQYTGEERTMLYVTVGRSQVRELKDAVSQIDPHAFMVIGMGQTAYGEGFKPVKRKAL